ncbi:MAG: radical SAM protein [Candidatus Zixiibacteriota bacterium]
MDMNNRSVLLINIGGVTKEDASNTYLWIPYGLLTIATIAAGEQKYNVKILDLMLNPDYLKYIEKTKPFVIGISATSPEYPKAIDVSNSIGAAYPDIPIIFGGVHPTLYPLEVFKDSPSVKAVVVGEGEFAFLNILERLVENKDMDGIPNVILRKNQSYNTNCTEYVDGSKFAMPRYDLIDNIEKYIDASEYELGYKALHIVLTRGCPYNCAYCSVKSIQGTRVRAPEAAKAAGFIGDCLKKYKKSGVEGFWLKDSDFVLNWRWVQALHKHIDDLGLKPKFSIHSNPINFIRRTGTSGNRLLSDRLEALSRMGVTHIWLGIESGSIDILKKYKQKVDLADIYNIVDACKKVNIKPCGFFMIGFWDEKLINIKETFKLMNSLALEKKRLHILNPLPGSRLYDFYLKKGLLKVGLESNLGFSQAAVPTKYLSVKKLMMIYQEMHQFFYEGRSKPHWIKEY